MCGDDEFVTTKVRSSGDPTSEGWDRGACQSPNLSELTKKRSGFGYIMTFGSTQCAIYKRVDASPPMYNSRRERVQKSEGIDSMLVLEVMNIPRLMMIRPTME